MFFFFFFFFLKFFSLTIFLFHYSISWNILTCYRQKLLFAWIYWGYSDPILKLRDTKLYTPIKHLKFFLNCFYFVINFSFAVLRKFFLHKKICIVIIYAFKNKLANVLKDFLAQLTNQISSWLLYSLLYFYFPYHCYYHYHYYYYIKH